MGWIDLAQDRDQWKALMYMVMNFRTPQNVRKFMNSCTTGSFARTVKLHEVSWFMLIKLLAQTCSKLPILSKASERDM
jgi:hypothetical protein